MGKCAVAILRMGLCPVGKRGRKKSSNVSVVFFAFLLRRLGSVPSYLFIFYFGKYTDLYVAAYRESEIWIFPQAAIPVHTLRTFSLSNSKRLVHNAHRVPRAPHTDGHLAISDLIIKCEVLPNSREPLHQRPMRRRWYNGRTALKL